MSCRMSPADEGAYREQEAAEQAAKKQAKADEAERERQFRERLPSMNRKTRRLAAQGKL